MSELSDDIARGCLPNGEPIEARWGTGEWSQQPEQRQEPDPWEEALAAAEQHGYLKALDDVMKKIISHDNQYSSGCWNDAAHMVIDMKSNYLRQEGKNGKQS